MNPIDITKIPAVMRANQWFVGAQLMETWFSCLANSNSLVSFPDTTTLKMDHWVLTFKRVQRVYDKMLSHKIWLNEKAQPVIVNQLKKQGKLSSKPTTFGDFSQPVPVIDQYYIQYRTVSYAFWDPVDDLSRQL